jgi:hypothetical protein
VITQLAIEVVFQPPASGLEEIQEPAHGATLRPRR